MASPDGNAPRDQNSRPTLLGVDDVTGLVAPIQVDANGRILLSATGLSGITLQTNSVSNSSQTVLNLTAGTNITLTAGASGLVTIAASGSSGSVTSVSVVSTNGFAGTVATATTTPAITISTSITGILQGNGTAISAASTNGTGNVVLTSSPALITPALGAATATSLNGLTITTTTGTLTVTNLKTLTVSDSTTLGTNAITFAGGEVVTFSATNALTFTTTGSTSITLPTSGTLVNSAVATLSSLTSIGTIGTGVWQGTPVTVQYGGTGLATTTAYSVICAGTTATGIFQSLAALGATGTVLTSNGAGALPSFQAAAGSSQSTLIISTDFSVAARFAPTGSGTITYGSGGLSLDTTATTTRSASVTWAFSGQASEEIGNPTFSCSVNNQGLGTDMQAFFGLGSPTVAGTGITYTVAHIGFKITRSASGTCSVFATQADGTTENASAALVTMAAFDSFDFIVHVISGTSVNYYWRQNGGALSAATNLTSNMPTGLSGSTFGVSNVSHASDSAFTVFGATYTR